MPKKRTPKTPAPTTEPDDDGMAKVDEAAIEAELVRDDMEAAAEEDPKARRAMRKSSKDAERSPEEWRNALRYKVKMAYDLQRLRIQSAGRGLKKADGAEIQLHATDIMVLDARAADLKRAEKNAFDDVKDHLASSGFYRDVLSDGTRFRGLGPAMAGVIMAEFDIHRHVNVGKMWAFAGLAPVPCRRCKGCKSPVKLVDGHEGDDSGVYAHDWKLKKGCTVRGKLGGDLVVEQTFESGKAMRPVRGEKLPYNAWLKTKLIGVLGPCLIKSVSTRCRACDAPLKKSPAGEGYRHNPKSGCHLAKRDLGAADVNVTTPPWRKFYDDYKHRKQSAGWGMSDGHRHNASVRYMVKMLLAQIWEEWRKYEGLPGRPSYASEYLGREHNDPKWQGEGPRALAS